MVPFANHVRALRKEEIMRLTEEYLAQIKPPTSSCSEKYSWNLYRFLKKYSKKNNIYVYKGFNEISRSEQYFFAITICGNGANGADNIGIFEYDPRGKSKAATLEALSYSTLDFSKFHEVSHEFFAEYLKDGKCAFAHPTHQDDINNADRFESINDNTKRCRWCGKIFRRTTKEIIIKKTIWEQQESEENKP